MVKGVNFVDLKDAGDPVAIAASYQEQGADELCFLDIAASVEGRATIVDLVKAVAAKCFMPLSVGGGVRSLEQIQNLMAAGADKVAINTAAIETPDLIAAASKRFGAQAIIAALDARQVEGTTDQWQLWTHGGRKATGLDAVAYAKHLAELGAGEILLTSMDRDGTKTGFDCPLTALVAAATQVPVIASGGAGALSHFVEVVQKGKATAVLAASVFHFGVFSIPQVKNFLAQENVPVRY